MISKGQAKIVKDEIDLNRECTKTQDLLCKGQMFCPGDIEQIPQKGLLCSTPDIIASSLRKPRCWFDSNLFCCILMLLF